MHLAGNLGERSGTSQITSGFRKIENFGFHHNSVEKKTKV